VLVLAKLTGTPPSSESVTAAPAATLRDPSGNGSGDIIEAMAFGPGGMLAALPDRYSVTSVAFGPGGMLAVGDLGDGARVWDTTTKRVATTPAAPHVTLTSVAFGPDATLAVSFADGQVYLWHLSP
jgi:WD40 repeat protein